MAIGGILNKRVNYSNNKVIGRTCSECERVERGIAALEYLGTKYRINHRAQML